MGKIALSERGRHFYSRLLNAIGLELRSDRALGAINRWQATEANGATYFDTKNLELYQVVSYVYTAIYRIAFDLSTVPLEARVPAKKKSDSEYDVLTDGPVIDLIKTPNPDMSLFELTFLAVCDLFLTGDAYWVMDPELAPVPQELYRRRPDYMKVVTGDKEQLIGRYKYREHGMEITYQVEDVIHFRLPNVLDHYRGQSAIDPIRPEISLYQAVLQMYDDYFRNCPIMGIGISVEKQLNDASYNRLRDDIKAKFTGRNRFEPPILEGGAAIVGLSGSPKEGGGISFESLTKETKIAILGSFGVPPAIAGILEYANYANMDAQERLYWKHAVIPPSRHIQAGLNLRIPPRFPKYKGLQFIYNYEKIDALGDNKNEVTTRTSTLYTSGIITLNEARRRVGEDPVPAGDEFKPVGMSSFLLNGINSGGNDGSGSFSLLHPESNHIASGYNGLAHRVSRSAPPTEKEIIWNNFNVKLTRTEKKFGEIMADFFREQKDRVLDNLDRVTNGGKAMSNLYIYTKDDSLGPEDLDKIFDKMVELAAMQAAIEPYIREIVRTQFEEVFAQLSIDASFSLNDPNVAALIEKGVSKMTGQVTSTTWSSVKDILTDGYNSGWTVSDVANAIEEKFASWYQPGPGQVGVGARAQMIAQTEMGRFVNGGSFAAYEEAEGQGLTLEKEWIHSRAGGDERPDHVAADGEVVGLHDAFTRTDFPMMHPHDPNGPADQVINCRCSYTVREVRAKE